MKKSTTLIALVALIAGAIAFVAIRSFLGPKTSVTDAAEIAPMPGAPTTAKDAPASVARAIPDVLPDFSLATVEIGRAHV